MPYLCTSSSVESIFRLLSLQYDYANFWKPNTDTGSARAHCSNNWINLCPPNRLHRLWGRPGTLFGGIEFLTAGGTQPKCEGELLFLSLYRAS
jgi:hypothetical protein